MNIEAMKERLKRLVADEDKKRKAALAAAGYFTEYDALQVRRLLDKWCECNGLTGPYSRKRGGYVHHCPGAEAHNHRERPDDCTLEFHHKSNGFVFLYYNCRHNSCSDVRKEHSNALNQAFGKYLNEHYQP